MSTRDALNYARERDLDLVEVAPNANPPVCRVLDYGRLKYLQAKKEREAKKGHKSAELREVRVRPRIGEHDVDVKVRKVKELLDQGDKVKISVFFRGREQAHPELGIAVLRRIAEELKEQAKLERPPTQEGRAVNIVLIPVGKQKQSAAKE